jgi:hypothetical protein
MIAMSCLHSIVFSCCSLLWLGSLPAQSPNVTVSDAVYPADAVTMHGEQKWITTRVLDASTGAPIPGAELLLIAESNHPMRGEMWWQMRAVADADGFVRLRADPRSWLAVRAPGYGTVMDMGDVPTTDTGDRQPSGITFLARGLDLPIRLLNWRGEPVPDALVGLCGGCGHTPDLVHGRTDGNGLVVLPEFDPHMGIADLYVEHPELDLGYDGVQWLPGEAPMAFVVEAAAAYRGAVVDVGGKPAVGAFVGVPSVHRGPWTRTGPDGSFLLCGADQGGDLFVHIGERELIFECPPVSPYRLVVPPPSGESVQVVNLPRQAAPVPDGIETVSLQVVDADGDEVDLASIVCRGPLPASTEESITIRDGQGATALLPGRYELRATAFGHAAATALLVVGIQDNSCELRLGRLPSVRVRVTDLPESGNVVLRTEREQRDITDQVRAGMPIGLPSEPFWLVLRGGYGDQPRVFLHDPASALAKGTLRLPWYRPTRIEGQLVDRDGRPAAAKLALVAIEQEVGSLPADVELEEIDGNGAFVITSEHAGLAMLVVTPDGDPERRRVLPIVLPPRGDDVFVEIGTVDIDTEPKLRLTDATGAPLTAGKVVFWRTGWSDVREGFHPVFGVDSEGRFRGPEPRAGDAILVLPPERTDEDAATLPAGATAEPMHDLTVHAPLSGPGPWTVALPSGELRLDIRGLDGKPVACRAFVGAVSTRLFGPTRLRRVPTGPQRVFVAADGHQSATIEVEVPASGGALIEVVLPRR